MIKGGKNEMMQILNEMNQKIDLIQNQIKRIEDKFSIGEIDVFKQNLKTAKKEKS